MNFIKKAITLFHPERFQGWGKTRRYFEGWYFKVVNADGNRAFAFIPGIAMDSDGRRQSFIQVLDGGKKLATYHRFEADAFSASHASFQVQIHAVHGMLPWHCEHGSCYFRNIGDRW